MPRIPEELRDIIVSDPEILGGTLSFKGTRVPVEILFDHVQYGYSLENFLDDFPSVERDQALAVLDWSGMESRRSLGIELL